MSVKSEAAAELKAPSVEQASLRRAWESTSPFRPVLILTVAMVVFLSLTQSGFATRQNAENLLSGSVVLWVVALGMTLVLITGAVDLSVAAIAVLAGLLTSELVGAGVPGLPAIVITMAAAGLAGVVFNGIPIGQFKLNFFIVTLASLSVLTGIANLYSGGESFLIDDGFLTTLGVGRVLGIPNVIILAVGLSLLVGVILRFTYFGRAIYAVGGSIRAAELSGIRSSGVLLAVYAISGALAALAGTVQLAQLGIAVPTVDPNLPLEAVAAAMLGGTSLAGGSGSVPGTVVGVLFIAVLANGLSIAGVPSGWQEVVTGVILVAAVLGNRARAIN